MKNGNNGLMFRICLFLWRLFFRPFRVCSSGEAAAPAVYVVHHQNLKGPIITICWFDKPVRLWVLSVFHQVRDCFRQYYGYTFTQRFKWPKALAAVVSLPLSVFISALMRSMRVIPVFRGSKDILKTFGQSINALLHGENLLIAPDIEYTSKDSEIGDMYDGFLYLEKYYLKRTGKHLPYIPLRIDDDKRCIYEGRPVYFSTDDNFQQEKLQVYERIKQEFSRLENL